MTKRFMDIKVLLYVTIFIHYSQQVSSDDVLCPARCRCHKQSVSCTQVSLTDLFGLDYKLEKFQHVDISLNELTHVPEIHVQSLNVSSNSIGELPEFTEDFEELYIRNNLIRNASMVSNSLKILDLSHNPVQGVSLVSKSLQVLDLSNGDIQIISETFMANLPSLKVLNLGDNPIKRLPELRSHSLEEIWVERTQIRLLKPSTFSNLSQLKLLNLRENKHIHHLHIESSAQLVFAENGVIEEVNLTGMPQLKTVFLNNNRIQTLILSNRVREIYARNNYLTTFPALKYVRKADFSNNFLHSLTFYEMDWLNISGNPVTQLKLESVDYLDASRCSIKTIHCAKSKFSYLNLSNNFIENFPCSVAVRVLDLSYNRLTSLKVRQKEVQELNLTGNRIVLAEDVIPQGKMYLKDNPWTCDCKMSHLSLVAQDLDSLQCVHPRNVSGITWTAACSSTKIPNWMRRYPYIPFVISCFVLFVLGFLLYWIKLKLDSPTTSMVEEPVVQAVPPPRVIPLHDHNDLPSYEEALLMPAVSRKSHALTQTRSYEVLSHRLSSSSI